ncbi:hypothetical protein [Leucobacter chromiireducens]|uniref:Uridine kinase n=1 Tax=Leucobacter chromiireducens subsp. solipictus TaxID=398235 RepID=A0ABS1SCR9_9MICO|nr:hypothetical protein [Leucobacter chromiireducens]MBL3678342.1 hypothetical protein [Leucobacter chromiireducens subsp. solipictus]
MGVHELDAIVIDGRSGSGKTSLADRLAARLRSAGHDAQILRVEDLYPGWDGLAEGSRSVAEALESGSYRRYDWHRGEFAERVDIAPHTTLIVEGCGAVTEENLAAVHAWSRSRGPRVARGTPHADDAVWSVWLDLPEDERRARAIDRDGEMFAPHWDRWAAQEDAHFAEHEPWELVHETLRG